MNLLGQKLNLGKNITSLSDSNRIKKILRSVQGKNNSLIDSSSMKINRYILSIQSLSGKRISNISFEQRHFISNISINENKILNSLETFADK